MKTQRNKEHRMHTVTIFHNQAIYQDLLTQLPVEGAYAFETDPFKLIPRGRSARLRSDTYYFAADPMTTECEISVDGDNRNHALELAADYHDTLHFISNGRYGRNYLVIGDVLSVDGNGYVMTPAGWEKIHDFNPNIVANFLPTN